MKVVRKVSRVVKDVIKEASGLLFQTELQRLIETDRSGIVYQSLSKEQINKLAQKIILLPLEYQHILFLRFCFKNTIFEIDKIMEIENTNGKLLYVEKMLSRRMALDHSWIDSESLEEACELGLKEYMKEYDDLVEGYEPNYSRAFRRKLKDIKSAQKSYEIYKIIAKRAAIFILISTLGLSAVLAINVEAREKFFHWIIETFPKFSILKSQSTNINDSINLTEFKIDYVPGGFKVVDISEGRNMLIYDYLKDNNLELSIKLFIPSDEKVSHYDTENADIQEFAFKGSQAYFWKTDHFTYLLCYQDGIECHISGNLDKNEMIKIAENIVISK